MPSLALAESVSATETIHAISGSALAGDRLKELMESPLHFKVAPTVVATGLNGRYTPLNKPFHVVNGIGGGAGGVNGTTASTSRTEGEGGAAEKNGDGGLHVNGDSGRKKEEEVISTEWPRILQRPPGLKNFMNTCYMNSTLQALMHIPPLVSYLLKDTHNRQCSKLPRTCTFCRLERHARESYPPTPQRQPWLTPRDIVGKDGVLNKFYSIFKQEDAHEFLLSILDKMDEAEKRVHNDPKHRSIIQRIFEGEFRQTITCDMCDHASHTAQPFQDLSLDILSRQRDLLSSLEYSVRPETLSDDNLYKCEKCGGKSRAKKRVTIHVAPPILAIHLKRFSASGLRKNSALVEYPEILDLNPYMSDGVDKVGKYRLIATVCHAGFDYSGMASGHYIAKCKSSSGTWHEFDDMNVFKVSLDKVLDDRTAYLLFYARDDPGKPRPPTANGIHKSPSLAASDKVNGISPPTKRPSPGDSIPTSPKRRKYQTDEVSDIDDDEFVKPLVPSKDRTPLGDVNNTHNSPNFPTKTTVYGTRPSASQSSSRPYYSPKVIPPPTKSKPQQSTFFDKLQLNNIPPQSTTKPPPSKPPPQEAQPYRPDKERRIAQLETTTQNPKLKDDDPFASGFVEAQARHRPSSVKYPGIGNLGYQPVTTDAYHRDSAGKKKTMVEKRNEFGIKTNRQAKNNKR